MMNIRHETVADKAQVCAQLLQEAIDKRTVYGDAVEDLTDALEHLMRCRELTEKQVSTLREMQRSLTHWQLSHWDLDLNTFDYTLDDVRSYIAQQDKYTDGVEE